MTCSNIINSIQPSINDLANVNFDYEFEHWIKKSSSDNVANYVKHAARKRIC